MKKQGFNHSGTFLFNAKARIVCVLAMLVAFSIAGNTPAFPAPSWVEQGPGPTLDGAAEGLLNNPVAGAINAIAVDPIDADVVYVGTVNGGIWKTTNATTANPTWTPLTDRQLPALSINSLAISPVDSGTLFAGTGSTSSLGFAGSPGFGVARSTNGGRTWQVLAVSTFAGRRINSIVPTALDSGKVVLAATLFDGGGVYRSTDKGSSFTRLSGNGTSGLPDQGVSSLVADPGTPSRFYAAVPALFSVTGNEGVYRSDDGGLTWTLVNTGLTGLNTSLRVLLSVHNNSTLATNVIYAMVISNSGAASGHLQGVFRSSNGGGTWTAMSVPAPEIFPGGQGRVHGAIIAHPTDPNVVFIAGDRQNSPFPNANGCSNFSANMFRGDASLLPGNPWQNVVCHGANGTSPHADARAMVFDANGDILHACDGAIYKLANPNNVVSRQWSSTLGDIRPAEVHSVAYDPLSNIVFGGTQDTGTTIQSALGDFTWTELLQGDGGNVAVDSDQTAHPGTTIRYTSFQFFGFFNRTTWDAANNFLGFTQVGLNITSGPGTGLTLFQFDPNIQFYQPFVLNVINPSRTLIGTANIYESMNRGDSLANLGFTGFFIGNFIGASPMAYGGRLNGVPNPDVFYVGAGPNILHRVTLGGPITTLSTYPGSSVRGLVINPQNYQHVFVLDDQSRVWGSFDEGASWINLTVNLPMLSSQIRAIEIFSPAVTVEKKEKMVLIAGGLGGVFHMRRPGEAKAKWTELSERLPPGLVLDLHYDYTDDVLVAGILGRGAWTLTSFYHDDGTDLVALQEVGSQPSGAEVGGFDLTVPLMPPVALPSEGKGE